MDIGLPGAPGAPVLNAARAAASRRNGAKSRGPRTPEGKARSAQNALKHGFRAQRFVVVGDEDPQEFAALEAALLDELAPEGALQSVLAARIARAAWRLERAERIEAELFAHEMHSLFGDADLGLALIRDCNGARAFDTLLRYRASAQAEFSRTLRTLKALQAEAAAPAPRPARPQGAPAQVLALPTQPEARRNPDVPAPASAADEPSDPHGADAPDDAREANDHRCRSREPMSGKNPIEPKARTNPGEIDPAPAADAGCRLHEGPGAHEATQTCVTDAPLARHSCAIDASPPANSA
jgi:hypothetical protein